MVLMSSLDSKRKEVKQIRKQIFSMFSATASASRFQVIVSSCPDFLQLWTMTWKYKSNTPCPFLLPFWPWCFVAGIENLTKRASFVSVSKNSTNLNYLILMKLTQEINTKHEFR